MEGKFDKRDGVSERKHVGRSLALLVVMVGIVFGTLAYTSSLTLDTVTVLAGMACAGAILMPITIFVGWVAFQSLHGYKKR